MHKPGKILVGTVSAVLGLWVSLDIIVSSAALTYAKMARNHYSNATKIYELELKDHYKRSKNQTSDMIVPAIQTSANPHDYSNLAEEQTRLADRYSNKADDCWRFVEKYGLYPNVHRLARKVF